MGTRCSRTLKAFICLFLCCLLHSVYSNRVNADTRDILKTLFGGYDSSIHPHIDSERPTVVGVSMHVNGFSSVSEKNMGYKVNLLLRQTWTDFRLAYDRSVIQNFISLPGSASSILWLPDTYIVNEKKGYLHDVTMENKLLRIYRNGTILYSQRLTIDLSCNMYLQRYPLDTQTCFINIESFGYTLDQVQFYWLNDEPVILDESLELPQFNLVGRTTDQSVEKYFAGNFSRLTVGFTLQRDVGYFFIRNFLPSGFVVFISWVSFWINTDAASARVSLGVTTVLTMVTLNTGFRSILPPVSYIKAVDIWMSACLFFVFAALVEFAFINNTSRKIIKDKYKNSTPKQVKSSIEVPSHETDINSADKVDSRVSGTKPKQIDLYSRVLFPFGFLIFNCVYWPMLAYVF